MTALLLAYGAGILSVLAVEGLAHWLDVWESTNRALRGDDETQ